MPGCIRCAVTQLQVSPLQEFERVHALLQAIVQRLNEANRQADQAQITLDQVGRQLSRLKDDLLSVRKALLARTALSDWKREIKLSFTAITTLTREAARANVLAAEARQKLVTAQSNTDPLFKWQQ